MYSNNVIVITQLAIIINFSSDIDECVEAALVQRSICPHSAYCVNNPGGYECTCPGDTMLIDGECIQCKLPCVIQSQLVLLSSLRLIAAKYFATAIN